MKNTNKNDLSDRRSAAIGATTARLQAYQAAKEAAEPNREARQRERVALAEARDARQALRLEARLEEQARHETAMREHEAAAATAMSHLRDETDNNRAVRVVKDEVARKAERDRRYANRKARKA